MEHTPRHIEQMIEHQVRLWEKQRELARRQAAAPQPWPLITISREFGARGAALGHALAQRTGFTVWERELLQAVAEEAGASDPLLSHLGEQHRNALEEAVRAALIGIGNTNSEYLQALVRVVHGLSISGSAIVVGRGASFVIDPGRALRVRVVCPLEQRVAGYAAREGLDEKTARRTIERRDAERADFARHQLHRNIGDAAGYDLVLNSGTLSEAAMADLVLLAYERKFQRLPPGPLTP